MILDEIVAKRKEQLARELQRTDRETMRKLALQTEREVYSFPDALKTGRLSIIAEVKKASPSKSVICADFHPVEQAAAYERAGADAISCLTEEHYFQGSSDYFRAIREAVSIPMLRKDFIIDTYQIDEARVMGADAILLIAAILDAPTMRHFYEYATELGLHCLFEAHNEAEMEQVLACGAKICGINNRNLKNFVVDLKTTERLAAMVPNDCILVSESGMQTHEDLAAVRKYGADAVYMGTSNLSLRSRVTVDDDELIKTIEYAHSINKKVYAALNIYARDNMYEEIENQINILILMIPIVHSTVT